MDPFEEERREQRHHFMAGMIWVVFIFVLVPTAIALLIWVLFLR